MSELLNAVECVSEDFIDTISEVFNGHYAQDRETHSEYFSSAFAHHSFSSSIPAMVSSYGMFNLMTVEHAEHISLFAKRETYKAEMKVTDMSFNDICQMQKIIDKSQGFFYDVRVARSIGVNERTVIGIKKASEADKKFLVPMQYRRGNIVIDRTLSDYSFKSETFRQCIERYDATLSEIVLEIDSLLGENWDIVYFLLTPFHYSVTGFMTLSIPDALEVTVSDKVQEVESFLSYILSEVDRVTNKVQDIYSRNLLYKSRWNDAWYKIQQRVNDHNQGAHVLARLAFRLPDCSGNETQEGLTKLYFEYIRTRQSYLLSLLNSFHISGRKSMSDIIKKFIGNKYSINYVSGVEGLVPKIQTELPGGNDVWISIPNGEIGTHAIYNILENIVRNTAKHAKNVTNENFNFTITIKDGSELLERIIMRPPMDDFLPKLYLKSSFDSLENYEVSPPVYQDNSALLSDIKEKEEELMATLSSMYAIIIREHTEYNLGDISEVLETINSMLSFPILDKETLKLREKGWGLIEMKTAAAYLRKIPKDMIDKYTYAPYYRSDIEDCWKDMDVPILKAIPHKLENGKCNLSYLFFVSKPQHTLVITSDEQLLSDLQQSDYQKQGLYAITPEEVQFTQTYNHEIVIIDDSISRETKEEIDAHATLFSPRLIYVPSKSINDGIISKFELKENKHRLNILVSVFYYNNQSKNTFTAQLSPRIQQFYGIRDEVVCRGKRSMTLSHAVGLHNYKVNPDGDLIFNTPKNEVPFPLHFLEIKHSLTEKYFQQELDYLYALPIKVVVLDERVQEAGEKQTYKPNGQGSVAYKELYKNTNIRVPDQKDINFSVSNYSKDCLDKTIQYLATNDDAYFYLLHIEVIEKLIYAYNLKEDDGYSLDTNGIESFLKEILLHNISLSKVVVLSGKGIPTNLPRSVRFIDLSSIAEVIIGQERNKYAFMEALFSARGLIFN